MLGQWLSLGEISSSRRATQTRAFRWRQIEPSAQTITAAPVSDRSLEQARGEIGREIHGSLTQEQRQALETITGPGGVSVLVGRAGTGKGVTIAAAAQGVAAGGQLGDRHGDRGSDRPAAAGRREARAGVHDRRAAELGREGQRPGGLKDGRDHGRGRHGRQRPALPARQAHCRARRQAAAGGRRGAALLDRPGRPLQRAGGEGPHRGADRGSPRTPRVGARGMGADTGRRTRPGACPIPGARPAAHPRHPDAGGAGDGRGLGPDPRQRARRAGGDDHRRVQQGARPDQRDGPGTPRAGTGVW